MLFAHIDVLSGGKYERFAYIEILFNKKDEQNTHLYISYTDFSNPL